MKKEKYSFKVGDLLSYAQVFDAKMNILTQEEFNKHKNDIDRKHKLFLDAEEWRKYIDWKRDNTEIYAVKLEDDKYEVKEINKFTNDVKDIIHSQENLDMLFKYHPMLNKFKYDEYSKTKEFNGAKYDEDTTPYIICNFFRRTFGEWCPRPEIKETIIETIDNNRYHFLCDYFDSLVWDGVERLDSFLQDYYGVEDNKLVRAYFSRWMIAMIKRTYVPGAKFDSMLILASTEHGKKKTSLFEWLGTLNGRKLYNDAPDNLKDLNDLVYATKGKAILLFDDFDDICDKGQLGKVKSFITQRARTAALKWQHDKDYPITYVLGGTTNNISILVDDATFEERRFWVVEVNPENDIFDISDDIKEQLYAEAVYRYKNDTEQRLWIWEPELKKMEVEWQKKYKKANEDPIADKIINIFSNKYPIKNGMFESEEQFIQMVNEEQANKNIMNDEIYQSERKFFGTEQMEQNSEQKEQSNLSYINTIPAAWVTRYLNSNARGTDRIVQILHIQGFKVQKLQRYWIYNKLLTVIKIINRPINVKND